MYEDGEGVPQDDKTAMSWYTLAAEQGHAKAQKNLGFMFADGRGVSKDIVSAYMWLNISASLGEDIDSKSREKVEEFMTPADFSAAQILMKECVAKNYKGC
jgi:TPR repeat protein